MRPIVKKILFGLGGVVGVVVLGGGAFVWSRVAAFDASLERVYDVPIPEVQASKDAAVVARGEHLAMSLAGCAHADCHGKDLAGGATIEAGPLGHTTGPNITGVGLGAAYSDGELMRLIEHGLRKDGRSVRFMPSHEINWLPEDDILAVISYVRSVPDVQQAAGTTEVGLLGKILDRQDKFVWDVARHIDHDNIEKAPPPAPTAEYGRHIGKLCQGCHGATFGGGPIPGAPPDMPVPANVTPHETGLAGWTYEEYTKFCDTGIKRNGEQVDPFMPLQALANLDDAERKALFAYMTSLPPKPFGSR